MPKQKRWQIKRRVDQAMHLAEKSAAYLIELRELYDEAAQQGSANADSYRDALDAIIMLIVKCTELMSAFRDAV